MFFKTSKAVFSASKQKYIEAGGGVQVPWGGIFKSRNKGIDTLTGKANLVLRDLYGSVVTKREPSKNAKLSIFKSVFVPILTCGHYSGWRLKEYC